jgi:hypothetical protein
VFGVDRTGWTSSLLQGWDRVLLCVAALALLTLTRINPAFIILGAAVFGFAVYR